MSVNRTAIIFIVIGLLVVAAVGGILAIILLKPASGPTSQWLDQLTNDLQTDATNANTYAQYTYEEEHYARDLENNLEARGYSVTYLVVFQSSNPDDLQWAILVRVDNQDNAVLINPRTDEIVTATYDGNGDGVVTTMNNPSVSDVSTAMASLLSTGTGNDGQYLIIEFSDYGDVKLVDTAVDQSEEEFWADLEEDNTCQGVYVPVTHDCDDFAEELEDAMEALGYRITFKVIYWKDDAGLHGHAIVNVHLANKTIAIEPQTDADVTATYDGDGDGTIETASPGSVRANLWIAGFELCLDWGTDGGYVIFEYEDRADVPFPLD